jgi:hypothetical protein
VGAPTLTKQFCSQFVTSSRGVTFLGFDGRNVDGCGMSHASDSPVAPPEFHIAIIGGGPRGAGVLERIAANLPELWTSDARIVIHVIDPHPAGPGRIWRYAQSPLLKLNSMAADVTMFTDESSTIDGPVRPGPSLIEWARLVAAREIALRVVDPRLRQEIENLSPGSFPTRRLQSLYLSWFFADAVGLLPETVTVVVHRASAARTIDEGRAHRIHLDDGVSITADIVLYSLGHTGADAEPEHADLIDFARRRELFYLPPAFTADADTRAIVPGQRVIVRGMGLAAVDLTVLLTEGRGGRFDRGDDGVLRYTASGLEPRLYLGSRRGVPYHSKISSTLVGERPEARYFTPAVARSLEQSLPALDLSVDVWPLIAKDMLWGYYRELFTGHPERVTCSWDSFVRVFDGLDPRALLVAAPRADVTDSTPRGHEIPSFAGDAERIAHDARAFVGLVEGSVSFAIDRLFLPELDRPLGGVLVADPVELQELVRDYIRTDLELRTRPEHSATLGMFIALLTSLFTLSDIVDSPKWTAQSRVRDLHGWWLGYFSFIASGPPAHRLEELVALSVAGIVEFLGAGIWVEADETVGVFRAGGATTPVAITASALVDARLPETAISRSDNELLRSLVTSGGGLEEIVADGVFSASTGRLSVRQLDTRLLSPGGSHSSRQYAIGPYTNSPFVGAFSRPRTNAISFRENDKVARAILTRLVELYSEWGRAEKGLDTPHRSSASTRPAHPASSCPRHGLGARPTK